MNGLWRVILGGFVGGLYAIVSLGCGVFLGGLGHCPVLPYVVVACPWDVGFLLWPIAGAILQIQHRRIAALLAIGVLTSFYVAFTIDGWRHFYFAAIMHQRYETMAYVLFAAQLGMHALLWVLIWRKCGPRCREEAECSRE